MFRTDNVQLLAFAPTLALSSSTRPRPAAPTALSPRVPSTMRLRFRGRQYRTDLARPSAKERAKWAEYRSPESVPPVKPILPDDGQGGGSASGNGTGPRGGGSGGGGGGGDKDDNENDDNDSGDGNDEQPQQPPKDADDRAGTSTEEVVGEEAAAARERSQLLTEIGAGPKDSAQRMTLGDLRLAAAATRAPVWGGLARRWPALRDRLAANGALPLQLCVEIAVGVGTKSVVEVQMRGSKFWQEFDFYLSDIMLEIVGDAMLVWLLSPVAGLRGGALPRHFGQLGSFNALQRAAALVVKGAQFGAVGFCSSVLGHGLTRWLVDVRDKRAREQGFVRQEGEGVVLAPVMATSLAWGGFLMTSSNVRYQMVNAVEQRALATAFAGSPAALAVATFALRLANCYAGSFMWLPWARMCGLQ